ncbi:MULTISPECIES: hypothetical protein [Asaia]|nr:MULTISPECIES: hypothetical protein [Asaia]ETD00114.1 hypothetical protein P792_01840 [Asaia sp. SF2.1]
MSEYPPSSPARQWLATEAGRPFKWQTFPPLDTGRGIFVGDPLSQPDTLNKITLPAGVTILTPWVYESGEETEAFYAHTNSLIWLEVSGTKPAFTVLMAEFSIDAACIGVFPAAAYNALGTLDCADDGPSAFDWVSDNIPQIAHFACTLSIPQSETPCFMPAPAAMEDMPLPHYSTRKGVFRES